MSTPEQRKADFESVFLSHRWGDPTNAGVNYKRKKKKTKAS